MTRSQKPLKFQSQAQCFSFTSSTMNGIKRMFINQTKPSQFPFTIPYYSQQLLVACSVSSSNSDCIKKKTIYLTPHHTTKIHRATCMSRTTQHVWLCSIDHNNRMHKAVGESVDETRAPKYSAYLLLAPQTCVAILADSKYRQ